VAPAKQKKVLPRHFLLHHRFLLHFPLAIDLALDLAQSVVPTHTELSVAKQEQDIDMAVVKEQDVEMQRKMRKNSLRLCL
jgi:hypothetical protein